jgi:lipoate-protein ligase A
MAVDEAIAQAVADGGAVPTLRLYTWTAPTVSLGYLQRVRGGVDLAECRRRGISLVRRATGGRAVLHAAEITYSVTLPLHGSWRALSVPEAFALVSRGLIAGLRRLGVQGSLGEAALGPFDPSTGSGLRAQGERANGREPGACFLARRMPAVLVEGQKLIGSAQRRWERSMLQHGSLLLEFDAGLHQAVFPTWPRTDPSAGVTCMHTLLGNLPPMEDLGTALAAGWGESFDVRCVPGTLTPAERERAIDLARLRYGSTTWTFQR